MSMKKEIGEPRKDGSIVRDVIEFSDNGQKATLHGLEAELDFMIHCCPNNSHTVEVKTIGGVTVNLAMIEDVEADGSKTYSIEVACFDRAGKLMQ